MIGPTEPLSKKIHAEKYRQPGEPFKNMCVRLATELSDNDEHEKQIEEILTDMRFLPGGRIQKDIGSNHATTAFNCFVSGTINDSMASIMDRATEAAETMRRGGGIGYDFSKLRPRGDIIRTLGSRSSGPVSFMEIFNAVCQTVQSAGHRRGAQMGVLRVDHPDIREFILAKSSLDKLNYFNLSVTITDAFMEAVKTDDTYWTEFNGQKYEQIKARQIWDMLMLQNWDHGEPGVLFIDRMNELNPLNYCETVDATNPCGEVPLPPFGACLLGSFNLVKYCKEGMINSKKSIPFFDFEKFKHDIPPIVRVMDNVIDATNFPLPEQKESETTKRRIGLGITGFSNACEYLGFTYGSVDCTNFLANVLATLRDISYMSSASIAAEKGSFGRYNEYWLQTLYAQSLPEAVRDAIRLNGLRNGSLLAIAPTGTISLCADNISSGIEPPYQLTYERTITDFDETKTYRVSDYAYREWGIKGKTALECTIKEHVDVLCTAQKYIDHAVSKTCNVGPDVSFDEFKDVYMYAWENGAKGITIFREAGKRKGVLNKLDEGKACYIDTESGMKICNE